MKKEKLLLLGNSIGTEDILSYAKSLGVETILTDYLTLEENHEKGQADRYWMIDVADLDSLERKCREEQVTAVMAATGEFCLKQARALCCRLGLPFYAAEEGERATSDKQYFKKLCRQFGLEVPKEYTPDTAAFPVIVKPVDSCAQRGLSICWDREELSAAIKKAEAASPSGRILLEEYVEGDEMAVFYVFREGRPKVITVTDTVLGMVHGRRNFAYVNYCSPYYDEYMEAVEPKIEKLLSFLECRKGVGLIQAIRRNGRFYLLELGYRLDAIGTWLVTEPLTGFSGVKWQTLLALGRRPEEWIPEPADVRKCGRAGRSYFIWGRPGRIVSVSGLEEVKAMEGVRVFLNRAFAGDEIPEENNMNQILFIIELVGNEVREMEDSMKRIKEILHVRNASEEELLVYPEI